MQTIEPFDQRAEPGIIAFSSTPGLRHYNPTGSVHWGYAGTLLASAIGLAVQSQCLFGSGYTTLKFKTKVRQSGLSACPSLTENVMSVVDEKIDPLRFV